LPAGVPEKYVNEFKEHQQDYLDTTTPSGDSARQVYNLWYETTTSPRKNYNKDSLLDIYRTLRRYEILSKVNYIKQNPNSYVSLFYLNQDLLIAAVSLYLPPDSLLSIYSLLKNELKNTLLGKAVNEEIIKRNSLAIGKKLPGFTFKTDNGTELSLSEFKNKKYVLLAFWASWCKPCRENIPALREVEKVYRDKSLQMISISVDEDAGKWLEAVKKYRMPWPQTCDLPLYIKGNIARSLFNIKYIPQYFLIDQEGVLIYHNVLSKDDDSHSLLKSILHNALN
jgi:peroxiredoxin